MTRSDDRSSHKALRHLNNGEMSTGFSQPELLQELIDDLVRLYDRGRFEEIVSKVTHSVKLFPEALPLFNNGSG